MAANSISTFLVSLRDSIEPNLLKAKAAYFFFFGAMGSVFPILGLWFAKQGLSKPQTGVLYSTRPFLSFIALPVAGVISDRFNIHKKLLIVLCIASICLRLAMLLDKSLIWISMLFMLTELIGTPVTSLLDAGVVELLGERKNLYGQQRAWGSLGFGFVAFAIGALVSAVGNGNFNIYFYTYAIMASISLVIFFGMPVNGVSKPTPIWKAFSILFASPQVFVFFLLITMIGMTSGIIGAFLFIFLDEIHASNLTLGLATLISCVSEVPYFFFSSYLLNRFGEKNIFYSACIAGIIRLTYYTLITNPWAVLPAEALHGIFFALMWAAAMSYVHKVAPPGLSATAQGLLGGFYNGLGNGIGSLVGGIIYSNFGYVVLFRAAAVWLLIGLIVFAISSSYYGEYIPPPHETENNAGDVEQSLQAEMSNNKNVNLSGKNEDDHNGIKFDSFDDDNSIKLDGLDDHVQLDEMENTNHLKTTTEVLPQLSTNTLTSIEKDDEKEQLDF